MNENFRNESKFNFYFKFSSWNFFKFSEILKNPDPELLSFFFYLKRILINSLTIIILLWKIQFLYKIYKLMTENWWLKIIKLFVPGIKCVLVYLCQFYINY